MKEKYQYIPRVLAILIVLGVSNRAVAGSELMTLLKVLRDNGTISTAQYQRVMSEAKASTKQLDAEKAELKAELEKKQDDALTVTTKGKLTVRTKDGAFESSLGGRVQADAAYFNEDGEKMGGGTEIRRARIYIKGKMFNDWLYKLEYDFASDYIADAYVGYKGFNNTEIRVGHFRDLSSLGYTTSIMEYSLIDSAFGQGRHIGIGAAYYADNWSLFTGVFGGRANKSSKTDDDGWGVAGRVTYAPLLEKTRLVHLGAFTDYRKVHAKHAKKDEIRFDTRPETHLGGVKLVDTGIIENVNDYLVSGLESAVSLGSWSAQAEYARVDIWRDGMPSLGLDGWYIQTNFFLTGESRPYKKGLFSPVKPKSVVGQGGFGAWEFVVRYSDIDLSDEEIKGGKLENFTIGLNWHPTSTLRFMTNYVNVLNVDGGPKSGVEPDFIQMRAQWVF